MTADVCEFQERSLVMSAHRNLKLETLSTALPLLNIGLRLVLLFFLKSTTISFVFLLFRMGLLVDHWTIRFCTSSIYADSSLLEIRPMTVVLSANIMMMLVAWTG